MALWKDKRPAEKSAEPLPVEANEQTALLREILVENRALRQRFDVLMDKLERGNVLGK